MIRRAVLTVLALAVLSGCAPAKPPERPEIVFSILSAESQASSEADWQPFLDDMAKALGRPVKAYYGSNYTALIEAMRFKQTDLGWFTNQSGLEAVRRANAEVFARSVNPSGVDGYEAVILVKSGSGLTLDKVLACDRSLDFGMGDPKSTSGTLAPMTYLFAPRKIDPANCFKTVRSANHETNLFSVAGGLLGAATNNTASMDRLKLLDTDMVWRKDFDPALRQKIAAFMFGYGVGDTPEAARQRKVLERIQTLPFKPANDSHLIPVREMEATGQLIAARNSGDAAAVAKAEAALAEVAKERAALQP
jgi:phosphonate transport system substrate-binding protein